MKNNRIDIKTFCDIFEAIIAHIGAKRITTGIETSQYVITILVIHHV